MHSRAAQAQELARTLRSAMALLGIELPDSTQRLQLGA